MKKTTSFLFTVGIVLTINIWLAVDSASTWALGVTYELTAESSYLEGCYEPCRCLLMQNQTLRGEFLLSKVSATDDESLFDVRDIAWVFTQDEEPILVTGSGTYQVAAGRQRLLVDLVVGESPEQRFDSGWVPQPATAPRLAIAVAVNEFFCYDYVFDLVAHPAAVGFVPSTWGHVKAIYR